MKIQKLLFTLSIVAFLGAGCSSGSSEPLKTATTNTPPTPTSTSVAPPVSASGTTLLPIDETWKTYSNKSLGFEFKWPTKGSYAPTWEVTFVKEGDSKIKDGCFASDDSGVLGSSEGFQVNDIHFCHTSYSESGAGNHYVSDFYATKKGGQFIVISLKKHLTSAGALNCNFVAQYPYSLNPSSCIPFKQAEYNALLKTIISTFIYADKDKVTS